MFREGLISPSPGLSRPPFSVALDPSPQAFISDPWAPPGGHDWQSLVGMSTGPSPSLALPWTLGTQQ